MCLRGPLRRYEMNEWEKVTDGIGWVVQRIDKTGYGYDCVTDLSADYLLSALNSGWISVENEMPEIGKIVHVNYKTKSNGVDRIYPARWNGRFWYVIGDIGGVLSLSDDLKCYTHWMELPEPPQ